MNKDKILAEFREKFEINGMIPLKVFDEVLEVEQWLSTKLDEVREETVNIVLAHIMEYVDKEYKSFIVDEAIGQMFKKVRNMLSISETKEE